MVLITLSDVIVEVVDLATMNHKYFSPADQKSLNEHIDSLKSEHDFIFRYFSGMQKFSEYYMGNIKFLQKILPDNTRVEKLSIEEDLEDFIDNLPEKQRNKLIMEG